MKRSYYTSFICLYIILSLRNSVMKQIHPFICLNIILSPRNIVMKQSHPLSVSGQFTPGQFTPGRFTPGQFTPGRFIPRYTLPFNIDIAIITQGELSMGRRFSMGIHPETIHTGIIYPGTIHPASYFTFYYRYCDNNR